MGKGVWGQEKEQMPLLPGDPSESAPPVSLTLTWAWFHTQPTNMALMPLIFIS